MRLPLIPPDELTTEQHKLYDVIRSGIAVSYHGVQTQDGEGALVGPFNPWLHDPDIGEVIWKFNRAIASPVALADGPREVATLVVGTRFRATYEVESHRVFAPRVGIAGSAVDAITSDRWPDNVTEQEGCAYDVAAALCAGGVVPEPLYARAVRLFGARGTSELVYLCGIYAVACMTMNAFDVPGPEPR